MIEGLLIVIFALCVAFVFNEGLWGAAVLFFNVLLAAVLATTLFEPVANLLDSMLPGLTYFADFVAIWLTFAICLALLRLSTDLIARHRVRFKKPVDVAGGVFFAVWIGWLMIQFSLFTMHMSPLGRNFMSFQEKPDTRMFFGLAPDRNWLAFIHKQSKEGAFMRAPPSNDANAYVFDPQGDYILKYGERRRQFAKEPSMSVK